MRNIVGGYFTAGAGPIFDDRGLAERRLQPIREQARREIDARSRRIADDDADRSRRIVLRGAGAGEVSSAAMSTPSQSECNAVLFPFRSICQPSQLFFRHQDACDFSWLQMSTMVRA